MTKSSGEGIPRTVRFRREELELIEEFILKNPLFDFSTLTRHAIIEFIKNPTLQITPVLQRGEVTTKRTIGARNGT